MKSMIVRRHWGSEEQQRKAVLQGKKRVYLGAEPKRDQHIVRFAKKNKLYYKIIPDPYAKHLQLVVVSQLRHKATANKVFHQIRRVNHTYRGKSFPMSHHRKLGQYLDYPKDSIEGFIQHMKKKRADKKPPIIHAVRRIQ